MRFFKISRPKKKSDEELLVAFKQSGDMALLSELFDRYVELVFGVCMKYLKNEENSKDAVMQIYEQLVEKVPKHEIQNFKSWLYVFVKNYCLMQLRKKENKNHVQLEGIISDDFMESDEDLHLISENGEAISEKELLLQLMESGLDELEEKQKQCLKLFYLEEKCYKEIVEITEFDLKKVKSYIQNGKRNLKIYMEKSREQQ
ncbi:RNA polymerase sigma factor [Chondrinema litorale]|uniref:RNA polymerase sigma factor n=1 Tax=Chondrinema litorale TaxID=2994555 RepID=UPI0025436876|nr:sigma-70 family RNA polymerase sigma factor [Chondrinema litorale]UZR94501.1 sigma-70 family RNA polymerase sigma factor [Chondrinema litorale]